MTGWCRREILSFHVNLIRHGRTLCRPRDPLCERWPVVEDCDYGQENFGVGEGEFVKVAEAKSVRTCP